MAYVPIPKDLNNVKTKVAFNMTKRQLIMVAIGGVIGFGLYTLTRRIIGQTAGMYVLMFSVIPCFFIGMYEKNGQTFEQILAKRIEFMKSEKIRIYKTNNIYRYLEGSETKRHA